MNEFKPGTYRHYKGNLYRAITVATHSETLEEMVVYQALYGERGIWVRPKKMFCEDITYNGTEQARFAYVSD